MIDPIITDEKILKKISHSTTWAKIQKLDLIARLKASNDTAWTEGAGLAAIQIGVALRVSWFKVPEGKEYILVNPAVINREHPVVVPKEGCLSIPNVWTNTVRFHEVTIRTLKEDGEFENIELVGFPAVVAQHEIDHMNGILNTQRRYIPPQIVGRNEPCPCGSGKKYKKCCIDKVDQPKLKGDK